MYRISCEKCVCFVFLVILAVLSCSGFRIDNLAMTDISKRNSVYNTSSSLNSTDEVFAKLFGAPPPRHRIRHHHRQLRAQAHPSRLFESRASAPPNEQFPQVPPSDVRPLAPARSMVRSQRSNNHPRKHKRPHCHDVSWKAYKADIVVVASAESMSSHPRDNYTVYFKVLERIKESAFPVDDHVPLTFSSDTNTTNCDHDENLRNSHHLVRARIEKSEDYVLFLDAAGAHNYSAAFAPELRRKKKDNIIRKVTSPNFRPKPVTLELIDQSNETSKRLKLVCKVKRGLPIPYIHWRRNETVLHPNSRVRITQKKRRSTLVIPNVSSSDTGSYECRTHDARGSVVAKHIQKTFSRPPKGIYSPDLFKAKCTQEKESLCQNHGKCFYLPSMGEYGCECYDGFTGERCQEKLSIQSSRYSQTSMSTCKLGIFTRYDNC